MKQFITKHPYIFIVVFSLLAFLPGIGSVHLFDWDEINFAECAREMIVTGNYLQMQIDFQPFYEKPPLFIWLQVLSMKLFGINEFAARFPNVIVGIVTLCLLYKVGKEHVNTKFGMLWCAVYACSLLPHFYFRTGIIDPLFNLFIFTSCWLLLKSILTTRRISLSFYAGIAGGLAVLTKGPVALGLIGLTTLVFSFFLRKEVRFPFFQLVILTCITLTIPALWFGVEYLNNGPAFITANLQYQWRLLTTGEAGHAQPWYYHPMVLLIGCFPASLFFFTGFRYSFINSLKQHPFHLLMAVLFFVVLIVFSAVTTKIIHYSSLCYIPLTFFAAVAIQSWLNNSKVISRTQKIMVTVVALLLSSVAVFVPWAFEHSQWMLSLPTFKDVFLRESLQQHVDWIGIEPLFGVLILLGAIGFIVFAKKSAALAVTLVLLGTLAFCAIFLPFVAPKIEPYTQGGMITFYKELQGSNVYIKPLTIKSYAHLFYSQKPQHLSASAVNVPYETWEPWLMSSKPTKPVYFVCKVNNLQQWLDTQKLKVIQKKGGYVLLQPITGSQPLQHHNH